MNASLWGNAWSMCMFWWPRHLRHQMLLLVAGVMVLAMAGVHFFFQSTCGACFF
jgi:hypothetical protein